MHPNSAQELQVLAFVLGRLEGIYEVGVLDALLGDLLDGPFSVVSVPEVLPVWSFIVILLNCNIIVIYFQRRE